MMNNRKILIISFQFPPLGGVGTRRMTKFSKYLSMRDYDVHVVTVDWDVSMKNSYIDEVKRDNIYIHRIPSGCPHNFFKHKYQNPFTKLLQSGIRFILERTFFYIDYAQNWGNHLLPYCENVIRKEKIVNVMATGAPFTVNYWAARLKQRVPEINLINDYRDLWNDDPAFSYFTPMQKRRGENMERAALDNSDYVVATTDQQVELLQKRCNNPSVNFVLLPNGFDPQDVKRIVDDDAPRKRPFSIVYTGNIGNGRDVGFLNFLKACVIAGEDNSSFFNDFSLELYGVINSKFYESEPLLNQSGVIHYHGIVSPAEAYQAVYNGFLSLLINADFVPYAGSSKIYEYFSLKRPIFTITPEGWIDNIITGYDLGSSVRTHDVDAMVKEILWWYEKWKSEPDYELSVSEELIDRFSYPGIVKKLEKCFL